MKSDCLDLASMMSSSRLVALAKEARTTYRTIRSDLEWGLEDEIADLVAWMTVVRKIIDLNTENR